MTRRRPIPSLDDEPCTIDGDVVAKTLERRGFPRMADFVRHIVRRVDEANQREDALRQKQADLVRRLHKYEPPPERFESLVRWTGD